MDPRVTFGSRMCSISSSGDVVLICSQNEAADYTVARVLAHAALHKHASRWASIWHLASSWPHLKKHPKQERMQVIRANNNAGAAAYRNEPVGPKARPVAFPRPCPGVMDIKYFRAPNNFKNNYDTSFCTSEFRSQEVDLTILQIITIMITIIIFLLFNQYYLTFENVVILLLPVTVICVNNHSVICTV